MGFRTLALLAVIVLHGQAPTGWTEGAPASTTAEVLSPVDPAPISLPEDLAAKVDRRTVLFYFSPRCSHCREAAPGMVRLAIDLEGVAQVLGVSTACPRET